MKRLIVFLSTAAAILIVFAVRAGADIVSYDKGQDYAQNIRFDRRLTAEIWADDNEYFEGDKITISFRTNHDCYVVIYNIDTRGRVNLLYPTQPGDNGWIQGDRIYRLPEKYDDYELNVQGPAGTEYLQIVASREPLGIPDWFSGSDLVCDDDPYDFMDYINATYLDCGNNCPRAIDLTSFQVKEWHRHYFRPVYAYDYPDWNTCGSVYIDYPFGATVYIDGIYWGVAPLFIPRIYWGFHYVTLFDSYGYCWEDRINIVRHKSIILDDHIIRTRAGFKSRYRDVERRGYLVPEKNGYPDFTREIKVKETYKSVSRGGFDTMPTKRTRTDVERVTGRERTVISGKKGQVAGEPRIIRRSETSTDQTRTGQQIEKRSTGKSQSGRTYESKGSTEKRSVDRGTKSTPAVRKAEPSSKKAPDAETKSGGGSSGSNDNSKKRR